jgi:SAM-dependent methyltransferase
LTERKYFVTGIDGSEEMLRYAGQNAPDTELILADARDFNLPPEYDAAISVFDSLNHVMTVKDLTMVFKNVCNALVDGGLFIFDLNMAAGFSTNWHDEFSIIEKDEVCIVRSNYNPEKRTAVFEAVIFNDDNGWRRTDVTLKQRCYTENEVTRALAKAGFSEVNAYACDVFSNLSGLKEDTERAFFIARKPELQTENK